jgi:methyltransferase (TIGR00027 family)
VSEVEPVEPESSAVRVALWRAMHAQIDAPPHVLEDEIGLELIGDDEHWRHRADMDPFATRGFRASIVARARFVEDLLEEQIDKGVSQYVILGAGLDTFAERRADLASRLHIFEVDEPGPQAWKQRRLAELGYDVSERLSFAPVDFEAENTLTEQLAPLGFQRDASSVVSSTGVAIYLTKDATRATLIDLADLAPGSTLAMTFLLLPELLDEADRPVLAATESGAKSSGTPFLSYYAPAEIISMALDAGFADAKHISGAEIAERYFSNRADGLRPPSGEDFLVATT